MRLEDKGKQKKCQPGTWIERQKLLLVNLFEQNIFGSIDN